MTDIFQPVDPTNVPDNAYEALVGEGKKFKDNEALAKSKYESDAFIKKLQSELEEMRGELGRKQSLEEIKTQILEGIRQKEPTPNQPPQEPEKKELDPSKIEDLVKDFYTRTETEKKIKSNRDKVTETLVEKFGDDAQVELNRKARELSVSLSYLQKIADESPAAFFRLIGVDTQAQQRPSAPAPRGTSSVQPQDSSVRNKAYYDKLKAQNPKEYFSSKVQNEMYKDAMKLKEAFYS